MERALPQRPSPEGNTFHLDISSRGWTLDFFPRVEGRVTAFSLQQCGLCSLVTMANLGFICEWVGEKVAVSQVEGLRGRGSQTPGPAPYVKLSHPSEIISLEIILRNSDKNPFS